MEPRHVEVRRRLLDRGERGPAAGDLHCVAFP
jgi:hypothetical protein